MKISLIGPVYPYRGGIAHHTTMLGNALTGEDHPTQIISYRRQFPGWLYPGESDQDPSGEPIRTHADYILDPFYPWTWIECTKRISSFNPDLVVLQWWTTFWAIPYAVIRYNLQKLEYRTGFMIHNVIPHEAKPWDKWLAKIVLSKGDYFIAQTPHEKDRLLEIVPNASVSICQIPTYSFFLNGKISREEARKKLALPPDAFVMLFFGIVRPYKGLVTLLDAMYVLSEEGIKPTLLIAGEFWEDKQQYIDRINDHHLEGQVMIDDRYIPNEEVSVYFSAADVMLAPYTGGTQSAVVGSALGFGLPLIVSEQIADGIIDLNRDRMYIIPAGDVNILADTIREFMVRFSGQEMGTTPAPDDWWRMVKTLEDLAA